LKRLVIHVVCYLPLKHFAAHSMAMADEDEDDPFIRFNSSLEVGYATNLRVAGMPITDLSSGDRTALVEAIHSHK
jgi:hypothetical protein